MNIFINVRFCMKTKLSSIFSNWINAIKKFPIAHLIAFFVTIVFCRWVRHWDVFVIETERLFLASIVGFALSLLWPLRFEKSGNSKKEKLINLSAQIFSLVLWLIYYLCIRNVDLDRMSVSSSLTYLWPIILAFVLLFLLIAIRYRDDEKIAVKSYMNIFWWVVVGWLVWLIVRGGVSGAIRSFTELITSRIFSTDKIYWYIWCLSLILLATSFGLNYYLVRNWDDKEIKPTWINKVFWTYIFVPLTLLYLAIFVLYGLKILITGVWPKWVLVGLGFGYFALGIVAIFLTYLQEDKKFKLLHKIIFGSFLLIAILMICAIYMRVHQYWFTINRYLVCAGICAIVAISILASIYKNKRFISFFAVLAGIILVSIYWWPIWAKQVSLRSQLKWLRELLQTENLQLPLKKDALLWLNTTWVDNIARSLQEISLDYDGNDWKNGIIDEEWMSFGSYDLTNWYLWYEHSYEYNDNRFIWWIYEKWWYKPSMDISEYKKMYPMGWWYYNSVYSSDDNVFDITIENEVVHLDLSPYGDMIYNFATENNDTEHPMVFELWDKTYVFTYAEWFKHDDGKIVLVEVGGFVFLK